MGVDAVLMKDGKEVAFLGRLHQFAEPFSNELETDYDKLVCKSDSLSKDLLSKIERLVYFVAGRRDFADFEGNWEELTKGEMYDILMDDIVDEIEYFEDEMIGIGKKQLLGAILEFNEDLSVRVDY